MQLLDGSGSDGPFSESREALPEFRGASLFLRALERRRRMTVRRRRHSQSGSRLLSRLNGQAPVMMPIDARTRDEGSGIGAAFGSTNVLKPKSTRVPSWKIESSVEPSAVENASPPG